MYQNPSVAAQTTIKQPATTSYAFIAAIAVAVALLLSGLSKKLPQQIERYTTKSTTTTTTTTTTNNNNNTAVAFAFVFVTKRSEAKRRRRRADAADDDDRVRNLNY